jgi:hypothetical protein
MWKIALKRGAVARAPGCPVVGRVKLHQKPWGVKNGKVDVKALKSSDYIRLIHGS